MFLSDVSIKRPIFALMLNLVLVVFGFFAYQRLSIDQLPDVDFPVVTVQVVYPGADPKSIEQKVIDPLEKGLNGLSQLESMSSIAYPNVAQIVLQFKLERDGDKAAQDVRDKVSGLLSQLPPEVEAPVIAKFDIGGAPILTMTLSSEKVSYAELSRLADERVKPAMEQVQGVGRVDIAGLREREIQVQLSRSKLQSFGLTSSQIFSAIQAQNMDVPSGKIETKQEINRIRTEGTLTSAAEIGQLSVSSGTQKIRVQDVANVVDTLADEDGFATAQGEQSIVLVLYKASGGNTVSIADGARAKVAELQKSLPDGVNFKIFQDNSTYIRGSIESVNFDLVLGAFLAIVIVFIFLHDWRATLISAAAIPTAVIATYAFIDYMGFTLNLMTTLGLTLSIGILVDDAIVVIENIHRRLTLGESPMVAAKEGTAEIGLAALAITLSIIAVFVPVAFMEGIMGRFFYQFGLTVAFAVAVSLFVAFTLTPMLSSRYLKHEHGHITKNKFFLAIEKVLTSIENRYKSILAFSLKHRWKTVLMGVGVLFVSVILLRFVPMSFFPSEDRSQFNVTYEIREGSSLPLMKEKGMAMDAYLRSYTGVESVVMAIGANAERKPNLARFDINMIPKEKRSFSQQELMSQLRLDLTKKFGEDGSKIQLGEAGGGGDQRPIQVIFKGDDLAKLSEYVNSVVDWTRKNADGAVDVESSAPPPTEEIRIKVDPVLAADLSLTTAQIGQALRVLFEGEKVGEIDDKGVRYDVRVKVADVDKQSVFDVGSVSIVNSQGVAVPLSNVATISKVANQSKIERRGGMRQISLLSNFEGKDLAGTMEKIQNHIKETLPEGVVLELEGDAKFMQESIAAMGSSMLLAILLVFMVLCAQFESFLTPFSIMMSVPLAFSGAFAALLITQRAMSIYAMIGLIMLVGLVTKNAILLIDFTLQRMREGLALTDALIDAGALRLRPILMTTLAMIFGMLPIAIGHGVGGEAKSPMAVCVIGGLISSTLLTLVVVPCIFSLLQGATAKLSQVKIQRKSHTVVS